MSPRPVDYYARFRLEQRCLCCGSYDVPENMTNGLCDICLVAEDDEVLWSAARRGAGHICVDPADEEAA